MVVVVAAMYSTSHPREERSGKKIIKFTNC
jgi:hypothetical protein